MSSGPKVRSSRVQRALPWIALLVLTVGKGLVWVSLNPPWKVADEPAHFDNIQYRAEHGRAPSPTGEVVDKVMGKGASAEMKLSWSTTHKYWKSDYLAGVREVPEEEVLAELGARADKRANDGQMTAMHYPGLYYNLGVVPYLMGRTSSILVRVYLVRLLSLLFGVVATLCAFAMARRVIASEPLAFAVGAMTALHPVVSMMTGAVNNDAALIGMTAVVMYLEIRLVTAERPTLLEGVGLGLAVALALMSKPQAFALGPGAAVAVLVAARRAGSRRDAVRLVAATGVAFVIGYLPGVFQLITTVRGFDTLNRGGAARVELPPAPGFLPWLQQRSERWFFILYRGYWGMFGWIDYGLELRWFSRLLRFVPLFLLGGLALCFHRVRRDLVHGGAIALVALNFVAAIAFVLYVEYHAECHVGVPGVVQGRSFLLATPMLATLSAAGMGVLVGRRWRSAVALFLILSAMALEIAAVLRVLEFHYAD